MEEERVEIEEQPAYQPRPMWQVWLARIAAAIVIVSFGVVFVNRRGMPGQKGTKSA